MDTEEDIKEASSQGWQEDYEGDNKKSAKEFLEHGSFFRKIDSQKQEIETLKDQVSGLTSHYEKVVANESKKLHKEYQQTIESLEADKLKAMEEDDHASVVAIEKEIRTTEKPNTEPLPTPDFDAWKKENDWYDKDIFLSAEADKLGPIYAGKGLAGRQLYDAITAHVKEQYPKKFTNENRNKPASVESGGSGSKSKSKNLSEKDLTEDERTIYEGFKSHFNTPEKRQQYFKQVLELRA